MRQEQLPEEKLSDLKAFCKLYGYLKFFHPSIESKDFNWDALAIYGTEKILESGSKEEVIKILNELFQPIAPSILIYSDNDEGIYPEDRFTPTDTSGYSLIMWVHNGYGTVNRDTDGSTYDSYVINSDTAEIDGIKIIERDLGNGIKVKFPSVLYYNGKTFPSSNEEKLNIFKKLIFVESKKEIDYKDNANAIANVIITWNVLQHFFPYFDVIEEVSSGKTTRNEYWENILESSLKEAYSSSTYEDNLLTLQHMVSALRDGHGFVFEESRGPRSKPPLSIEWIENLPVVVKSEDETGQINEGDIILEVDGLNVFDLIKEIEKRNSASTQGYLKIHSVCIGLLKGEYGSEVEIKVRKPNGDEITQRLKRTSKLYPITNFPSYEEFFEITDGIYYSDVRNTAIDKLIFRLTKINESKGVIFDIRGRPQNEVHVLLQHLTGFNINSSKWMIPRITEPDFSNVEFKEGEIWDLPPLEPQIRTTVVFLTNARAVSYGESIMAIVKNYKLGTIIGERTAGTNGDVNSIFLPGGLEVSFTGMKVLNHDNSRFHGIGVEPDIEVRKTLEGVRQKRDEQFERAVEFIKTGK